MAANDLSPSAVRELDKLLEDVRGAKYADALKKHAVLVESDWTGNETWITGLRTLLTLCKTLHG